MMDESIRFCPKCANSMEWRLLGDESKPHPICGTCGFVLWQNPLPSVEALVVRDTCSGKEVLLGRRSRDPLKGKWDVPGGFLGMGDDPTVVICRECLAEFNAEVNVVSPVCALPETFQDKQLVSIFYLCELASDHFAVSDRTDRIEWFPADKLPEMAFPSVGKAIDAVE